VSTPIGHTLTGIVLARRLGLRSPFATGAAVVAASLPDIDVLVGLALHGDAWKVHRKGTHTPGFALTAGMLAGFAGVLSAGSAEGERDLVADAFAGALLVGSHVVLDNMPFPYFATKRGTPPDVLRRNNILNLVLDAAFFGALAWKLWPRGRA
jgi:hypothetical protein